MAKFLCNCGWEIGMISSPSPDYGYMVCEGEDMLDRRNLMPWHRCSQCKAIYIRIGDKWQRYVPVPSKRYRDHG